MRLFISEVLEKVRDCSTDEEKIKILKENDSVPLKQILYANFSPKIKFLLPDAPTPYKPKNVPIGLADANLLKDGKKLYLFVEGGHPTLPQTQREKIWISFLETLQKDEALVLESLKNKNLEKDYKVTRNLIEVIYPGLLEKIYTQEPTKRKGKAPGTKNKKTIKKLQEELEKEKLINQELKEEVSNES